MSYSIEYASVFIKSESGVTAAILSGDNNCWEAGNKRRARHWSVWQNMLGVPGDKIIAAAEAFTGGPYQEHWKKGGKCVDDAKLMRWARNGVESAADIESILRFNGLRYVSCWVSTWHEFEHGETMRRLVTTTQELNAWIRDANAAIAEKKLDGISAYPVIEFYDEKVKMPKAAITPAQRHLSKVLIKKGRRYLYEYTENENGRLVSETLGPNATLAEVFTVEEAEAFLNRHSLGNASGYRVVDAKRAEKPYNVVLRLSSGNYVERHTSKRIFLAYTQEHAKRFADKNAGIAAKKRVDSFLVLLNKRRAADGQEPLTCELETIE